MSIALDRGPQDAGSLLDQLNVLRRQIDAMSGLLEVYHADASGTQFNDFSGNAIGYLTTTGDYTEFALAASGGVEIAALTAAVDGVGYSTVKSLTSRLIADFGVGFNQAELPAPTLGMVALILDSNTATWGANITGTGAFKVLAFYNGTNWTVVAK